MQHFRASDGLSLAYTIDDFTDPWLEAPTLLLLHAAMGHLEALLRLGAEPLPRTIAWCAWTCAGTAHPTCRRPSRRSRWNGSCRTCASCSIISASSAHIVGNSAGGYIGQQLAMNSPERVASLMLFGSTPGLKNSQALTWIPRVAKDGLRKFLRRHDLGPLSRECRPAPCRMVSRRGREERHRLHRALRHLDGLARMVGSTAPDQVPDAGRLSRRRDGRLDAQLRRDARAHPGCRGDLLRGPAAQHLRQRAGPVRGGCGEVFGEAGLP